VDPIFPRKRFVERTRAQQISPEETMVGKVKCGDETCRWRNLYVSKCLAACIHTIFAQCCRQAWGMQMLYKGVPFSVLKIDNLLLTTDPNRRETRRKWKSAPFPVTELSSEELVIVKEYLSWMVDLLIHRKGCLPSALDLLVNVESVVRILTRSFCCT